jgi:hypothetical protein
VDFGAVSVGIPSDQIATIKNVGDNAAVFWISSNTPGIKAAPEKGCILAGESLDIMLTLKSLEPALYEDKTSIVTVNLRGAKPLLIPFSAEVVLPDVTIVEER